MKGMNSSAGDYYSIQRQRWSIVVDRSQTLMIAKMAKELLLLPQNQMPEETPVTLLE